MNGTLGTLAKVGHGREIVSALGWTASNALVRANISTQLECILAPIGGEDRGEGVRPAGLKFVPAMRALQRAAVLSTFSSNEWDSKQDKTWIFGPGERHGDRARPPGHRETQRLSSLIENSPRHRKKNPSHFGPEEDNETSVQSLDGKNGDRSSFVG